MPRPHRQLIARLTGLAVFFAVFGMTTAVAATGGQFLLGRHNTESRSAVLANPNGTPLVLQSAADTPPLRVNSSARVPRLDADLLDGQHADDIVGRAREGLVTAWQVEVSGAGAASSAQAGVTAVRHGPGDYSVLWSGFPGRALPYCTGIGRTPTVVAETGAGNGSGSVRVNFGGVDTAFTCLVVGLTG